MATYVNDLRLKEIATGDESGTWGTSTNTNLELIANAMGVGAEAIANASTHTITMADGTADEFRSTFLRLTGGGTACTVTLAPNTLSHTWIMRNETAAALTLTQGSGANVAIAAGQTKIVATDGGGSGAIVYEMDDLELAGNLAVTGAVSVTGALTGTNATFTTADNTDTLSLISTDADASVGPNLSMFRNSASPADSDELGNIAFYGRNDNSQTVKYAEVEAYALDVSDGTEDSVLNFNVIQAGAALSFFKGNNTEVVVNDDSKDLDFRVESDGNTHALFVEGSTGKVGIGTSAPGSLLDLGLGTDGKNQISWHNDSTTSYGNIWQMLSNAATVIGHGLKGSETVAGGFEASTSNTWGRSAIEQYFGDIKFYANAASATTYGDAYTPTERMRVTQNGLVIGQTAESFADVGTVIYQSGSNNGAFNGTRDGGYVLALNRLTSDGNLIEFYKDTSLKGTISVSGSTISYNPFMGSHYSETTDTDLLFGTVMETTGELVEDTYSDQKRLTKTIISTTQESSAVYGVWLSPMEGGGETIAAVGASWCRINSSATLAVGDLLTSNGDGTAKVQSDDIIRSKTIGKVTSTSIKETHPDGSYVVPVVLYCG